MDDHIIVGFCHSHQNLQETDVILDRECLSLTSSKVCFILSGFHSQGVYRFPLDSPHVFLFEKYYCKEKCFLESNRSQFLFM